MGSEVVVVGAGIAGASAAWHLARRGHRVTVLEQFELGHTRGSSHGAARIFRLAYDRAAYVRLGERALPLWREAGQELGEELMLTTGGLDCGPPAALDPIARTLAEVGVSFDRLSRAALVQRFPAYDLPGGWEALYSPQSGVVLADKARLGLVELARREGAEVREGTRALSVQPDGSGATVQTSGGQYRADVVVLATAGWSNSLLEPLGLYLPLTVTREHVVYFQYGGSPPVLPFIWHDGRPFEFYGLPNGEPGVIKVGENAAGPETDPDAVGEVDQERLAAPMDFARCHLPGLGEMIGSETCLYASTPDDDFVVDRIGAIVVCAGFGGHGFKFGAVIGELAADVVEGKPTQETFRYSTSVSP